MPSDRQDDLRAFRNFIEEPLASGRDDLTLDDALALWNYGGGTGTGTTVRDRDNENIPESSH